MSNETNNNNGDKYNNSIFKSLVFGAMAGATAKTCIAPLDRLKIIIQSNNDVFSYKYAFKILKMTVQHQGWRALWKGNSATMARIIPYAAVQFTSYEQAKRIFYEKEYSNDEIKKFLCGCCAGLIATASTYPLDLIRARLAVNNEIKNTSILNETRLLIKNGRFFRLYRGFLPTILGILPYSGVSFYTYETLKEKFSKLKNNDSHMPTWLRLICGGCAGVLGQTCSYPFDVVRRKLQTDGINNSNFKYVNIKDAMRSSYHNGGIIGGFYRGLSLNWIKGPIAVSISFTVFDLLKNMFN